MCKYKPSDIQDPRGMKEPYKGLLSNDEYNIIIASMVLNNQKRRKWVPVDFSRAHESFRSVIQRMETRGSLVKVKEGTYNLADKIKIELAEKFPSIQDQ